MKIFALIACCLFFVNIAHAQSIIKLNSGKVIEANITEKGNDYIKVDFMGVNITYFKDEIKSIEGVSWQGKTPEKTSNDKLSPTDVYFLLQKAVRSENLQEIKKYLSHDKIKQIEKSVHPEDALKTIKDLSPKDIEIISEKIDGENAKLVTKGTVLGADSDGIVNFVNEGNGWVIKSENWDIKNVKSSKKETTDKNAKNGKIKGSVILPGTEDKGDLFISFVPSGQMLQYPGGQSQQPYAVIKKEDIRSNRIPFSIQNVPPGNYWGYATWDIAAPFWEPAWGAGNCPGYGGDYVGGTKTVVTVEEGKTSDTNINCTRHLKK